MPKSLAALNKNVGVSPRQVDCHKYIEITQKCNGILAHLLIYFPDRRNNFILSTACL